MLATMLVLVSWGMVDTVQILLDQQFVRIQKQDVELRLGGRAAEAVAAEVAGIDGVAAVELALTVPVSVGSAAGTYSTVLTALQPDSMMHELVAPDGSTVPLPGEGLVVGAALRHILDLEAGDVVSVDVAGLVRLDEVPIAGFVDEPLGTFAYTSLGYVREAMSGTFATSTPEGSSVANTLLLTFDARRRSCRDAFAP